MIRSDTWVLFSLPGAQKFLSEHIKGTGTTRVDCKPGDVTMIKEGVAQMRNATYVAYNQNGTEMFKGR